MERGYSLVEKIELPFRFIQKIHQGSILCGTVFVYYGQVLEIKEYLQMSLE